MDNTKMLSETEVVGQVQVIPVPYLSSDEKLYSGGGFLLGYSLRNRDDTTDAVVSFCDGEKNSNAVIDALYLPAKSSKDFFTDMLGIPFTSSLLLAFIAGTISGAVFVRVKW